MKPFLLLSFLWGGFAFLAHTADLPQSGTNRIRGDLRFANADPEILARLGPPGNEGIHSFAIFAYTDDGDPIQSSKSFSNADLLSNPYELTVTANDAPLTYHVYGSLSLDSDNEEYWTSTYLAAPVTRTSAPGTVDISECVGLVELRYVDGAGLPVQAAGGRGLAVETGPPGSWRARYLQQPPGRTENFLAVPSGVELELSVEVDLGTDIYLNRITYSDRRVINVACDEKLVVTLTLPDAGGLGRISGNVNMVGELEFALDGYQELLGRPVMKAKGPVGNQRYAAVAGDAPGPDLDRPFSLDNLVPSVEGTSWNVWLETQFGSGDRFEFFRSPGLGEGLFNPGATVTSGELTDLGDTFVMNPARLAGKITLLGPPEVSGPHSVLRNVIKSSYYDADMNGAPDGIGASGIAGSYVVMNGVDQLVPGSTYTAAGGSAAASLLGSYNPATASFEGDYEVRMGNLANQSAIWRQDGVSVVIANSGSDGSPAVDESIYIVEADPWQSPLAAGENASRDLRYSMAEVCLRITSPVPFYYPRVTSSYGGLTNVDSEGNLRAYTVILGAASSPPYTAAEAVHEAVITLSLPEGHYSLHPSLSVVDVGGGISEVQLPSFELSLAGRERYCIEDCLRIEITPPVCTTNFGFLIFAKATSCEATLTNLSMTTRPLSDPKVRLGYSDIRILSAGKPRTELQTAHGLFPEFDGFLPDHPEYYTDMIIIAEARDNKGRVATRQIIAHYDFKAPEIVCPPDKVVLSSESSGAIVDFEVTATDDRPGKVILICTPPSGSLFPPGTTTVQCIASDLCHNTNRCSFSVTVRPPDQDCPLKIEIAQVDPLMVRLTWDCDGNLQSADELEGPWQEVAGAASPFTAMAGDVRRFYRLVTPTVATKAASGSK